MAELTFETLSFKEEKEENTEVNNKDKERIKVRLLKQFYFYLDKEELEKIAPFKIEKNKITFKGISQEKAEKKFGFLLDKRLKNLKNSLNNSDSIYVHQNSGIPLIGNVSFGLVYRDTSLIEIKPMTSCNLNCIFCSVGEGIKSKKVDFVVEKDYLVSEFKKLLNFVEGSVEAHIGIHGEPFLYADILLLIKDLNNLEQVHTVSLDTNGTLLNKKIIDELNKCNKLRLNISLHTLNPETAKTLAGCPYDVNKIIEIIKYAKNKVNILLTPLIVPTYNDGELEDLVKFAKENGLELGVQNFLNYKTGRNPVKPWSWKKFYSLLKELEEKYDIKLIISPEDFKIKYSTKLEKPFVEGDVVFAEIVCSDRFPNSRIAVFKGKTNSQERTISIPNCDLAIGKRVQVKITRDKHNIFNGKII